MSPRFLTLFWRQMARPLWRHPWLTGLSILSIALGVTVFLAVQIANHGALASFRTAADLTTGRAQLEVRGPLDDKWFPEVAATAGVRAATPMVEGVVALPEHPGEYLHILGVDPFTGEPFFSFQLEEAGGGAFDWERWLADPTSVALHPDRLRALGPGPLRVLAGTSLRTLHPAFTFTPEDAVGQGSTRFAAMDIGWAQELFGRPGELSSIQILLDEGVDADAVAARLRGLLPGDVRVGPPALRNTEMETLLGAFQLNLTALSLVSLIVGMFLIYNCVAASVTRRLPEIAILRAAGTTRTEIRVLFLGEALLNALLGIALGLGLAPLLAAAVAGPVSKSISSLYGLTRIGEGGLDGVRIFVAVILGLGAALVAAWGPASRAARIEPARILRPGSSTPGSQSSHPPRRLGLALLFLLAALGLGVWALAGGPREMGFGSAAGVLAGFSLLVPWFATAVAAPFRRGGPLARCAADQFLRALPRNTITMAALAAALAMTVSVTVMIHSFRASVERWALRTLTADLYIAPAVNALGGRPAFLPDGASDWAAAQPEVESTATFRETPLRFRGQLVSLSAAGGGARGQPEMVQGRSPYQPASSPGPDRVAVSESLARRFDLTLPTTIRLPTPEGEQPFRVSGVYRDFTRDRGVILMPRAVFARWWHDARIHSLALKLHHPTRTEEVAAAFRKKFGAEGQFALYDNAALRERVREIFDQTFAVTRALRAIAVLVAVAGVLFSLGILVLERSREIGVLRALGASRGQILGIFLLEAALIALAALICGMLSGAVLAMVLTWVINQAFFGWTIALDYPLLLLATTPLWFLPAALLAAILPAWRASRVPPALALRFE